VKSRHTAYSFTGKNQLFGTYNNPSHVTIETFSLKRCIFVAYTLDQLFVKQTTEGLKLSHLRGKLFSKALVIVFHNSLCHCNINIGNRIMQTKLSSENHCVSLLFFVDVIL
jgi:hypothetical protein